MSIALDFDNGSLVAKRKLKNSIFKVGMIILSILTVSPIVLIIYELIVKGFRQINIDFFTQNPPDTFEAMMAVSAGEVIPGGILNGLTGTLLMVLMASVIAIPVGIMIGIFLYENPGKIYSNIV